MEKTSPGKPNEEEIREIIDSLQCVLKKTNNYVARLLTQFFPDKLQPCTVPVIFNSYRPFYNSAHCFKVIYTYRRIKIKDVPLLQRVIRLYPDSAPTDVNRNRLSVNCLYFSHI